MADDFGQNKLRGIAGDRKTNALRAADDRRVDADHLGRRGHQRPAGVAGIESGVGLNDVFDSPAAHRADRAAERRHHARRNGRLKAQRIADCDDQLAAAQCFGIAERGVAQIAHAVGAQQRQIGVGVDAEYACVGDNTLDVPQPDLLRRSNHVIVGQHKPVRGDNDPGAKPAALARVPHPRTGFNANNGGTDALGHADHSIGIGVEQRAIVGRGLFGRLR